jgi:ganglioside-induced differentiation-associated protein 1
MIELYHHGSSVCAAKVRLVLAEKQLEWKGHYIDILKGDQFNAEYMTLNPKAVVPTLVHDGNVILESTVACEYLDEVFASPPLKPASAAQRAAMRLWTKAVDEDMHPACAEITFASCHRHIVNRLGPDGVRRFLESTPSQSVTPTWHERKKQIVTMGFKAPGLDRTFRIYDDYLQKMENTLQNSLWLVGDAFSLADIGMAPYVNRLDMMGMSEMWTISRPHLTDWLARFKARPSFQAALLTWCPPDLTDDLKAFGQLSWPEAKTFLNTTSH